MILPNIDEDKLETLKDEPALTVGRLTVSPGYIEGNMVSGT